MIGVGQRGFGFAAKKRLNRAGGFCVVAPRRWKCSAERGDIGAEFFAQGVALPSPREWTAGAAGGDGAGGEPGGEAEAAGVFEDPVDEWARAGDVTADAAKSLAER